MRDAAYVASLPVGVRHVGDNLAIPALAPEALRVRRHILLAGCQDLVWPCWCEKTDGDTGEIKRKSEFRTSVCGRTPVSGEVSVYQNGSGIGYSGIMRCGSIWACPICAAKIMRIRADQIGQLFDAVHGDGGSAVMVTYTASHGLTNRLADTLDRFKLAKRDLEKSRQFRTFASERAGAISATEITYSIRNGWHPHQHDVWFFSSDHPRSDEAFCDHLSAQIFSCWQTASAKHGLETKFEHRGRRIGVDVRLAWDAADYLTKFDRERTWSLPAEITAGRLKMAQGGSLTPWAILEDAIIRGKQSPAATLWLEYLRATRGKKCIVLRGADKLLKHHGLPTALDDFKDANAPGEGEVIATLTKNSFDSVVRAGGLGRLLEAARAGGLPEVDRVLQTEFPPVPSTI